MVSAKSLHTVHRWTGLITGINILVLSITGAYLVFHDELNQAFSGGRGELIAVVDPRGATPVQDAFGALIAKHPSAVPMRVRAIEHAPGQHELVLFNQGAPQRFAYDIPTGEIRTYQDSAMTVANDFVFKLHATLFLGTIGAFVLGLVALLFLTSTVTGIFIYAPFMKRVAFGAFRRGHGLRRAAADVHKLIGATSLAFNLLMAATGIALTVGLIGVQMWSMATIQSRTAMAGDSTGALPPIDAVLAAATAVHPDAPINNVAFPGGYQGKNFFMIFHENTGAITRYIPTLSLVPVADPGAAEALEIPVWVKAIMICFPLHFGNFAGLGLKIVYSLFGLSSGALTLTGLALSAHRWRTRRRARARRCEAVPEAVGLTNSTELDA